MSKYLKTRNRLTSHTVTFFHFVKATESIDGVLMSIANAEDTSGCCKDDRKIKYERDNTKKARSLILVVFLPEAAHQMCSSYFATLLKSHFWHGCSTVNLLHIFKTPFYRNIYGGMLPSHYKWRTVKSGYLIKGTAKNLS